MKIAGPFALLCAVLAAIAVLMHVEATRRHAAVTPSDGHAAPYSRWSVNGTEVRLDLALPITAAHEVARSPTARWDDTAISKAIVDNLGVTSAGGDCPVVDQGEYVGKVYVLSPARSFFRYELFFRCPSENELRVYDHLLFDHPGHVAYAKVNIGGGPPTLRIFTRDRQTLSVAPASRGVLPADLIAFVRVGAEGLLTRLDRLSVILGLALMIVHRRDLADFVVALSAGYVAAAAVIVARLNPDPGLAEALSGLLAAVVGLVAMRALATNLNGDPKFSYASCVNLALCAAGVVAVSAIRGWSPALACFGFVLVALAELWIVAQRPERRWWLFAPACLLGFLDGASHANALGEAQLDISALLAPFAAVCLGAVAAASLVAALVAGLHWLARTRLKPLELFAIEAPPVGLVGLGLFWYLSRLYG